MIDTDVVVSAVRSRSGASAALLSTLIEGRGTMLISVALALEYETTALLPEHVMAGNTTMATASTFLNMLMEIAEPVKVSYQYRPLLSDPGDEMVVEAAINGQADAIVSFNQRDYWNDAISIPQTFGIDLINPAHALQKLWAKQH